MCWSLGVNSFWKRKQEESWVEEHRELKESLWPAGAIILGGVSSVRKPNAVDVAIGLKLGYSWVATNSSPLREVRE